MAEKNSTILASLYEVGTNDYQQLVPAPTQASVRQQFEAIFAPNNGRVYNEFVDSLVNRIGATYITQKREWTNPFSVFYKGNLPFGFSVQEVAAKFIKAHSYLDSKETLLKMHRPEMASAFHTVDVQQYYPVTVNRAELEMAAVDEYGLNQFVDAVMIQPANSANYDLYNTIVQTFAEAESNWGMYKVHVDAVPNSKESAQTFLAAVKEQAATMTFPSTLYNSSLVDDIPVFSRPDELVLLMTPAVKAATEVFGYADLFNLEEAEAKYRTIVVREFPIPGVFAALVDENFFQLWTKLREVSSFYNPETLGTTYYYHVWDIISASPFANAVLYTTAEGTETGDVTQTVSAVEITPATATISAGDTLQLSVDLTGTISPATPGIAVRPDSVTWEITGKASSAAGAAAIDLNSRTYVDRNNLLHTQTTLATGNVLTLTGTATYTNPSGATSTYTDTCVVTIA